MVGQKGTSSVVSLPSPATTKPAGGALISPSTPDFSSRAERCELFLPVTGFMWFYPEEMAVINHPTFQRLSRINQLGQAYLVFRGATHKRIEHVLGAVQIAQRMVAAVRYNQLKLQQSNEFACAPLDERETRFIRLAVLLHDIGHLPARHTIEDELGLVGAHDADQRLSYVFNLQPSTFGASTGQTLAETIDEHYALAVPDNLASAKLTASKIAQLIVRKPPKAGETDQLKNEERALAGSAEVRLDVCQNMVGNTICADLLDYLYRDWYHLGKPRSFEDRILQYMEIRNNAPGVTRDPNLPEEKRRHPSDRFVISLGRPPKIRTDGVSAILGLLEWRYELAEIVLFHRVKCTAAAMLDRALFELWSESTEEEIIKAIFHLSDEQLIDEGIRLAGAESKSKDLPSTRKQALGIAVAQLNRLKHRELFKELWTRSADQLSVGQLDPLKRLYGGEGTTSRAAALNRITVARLLEADFHLAPGSIAIHCAEAKAKIAEVAVAIEEHIAPLHDYERRYKNRLSGGHLAAQINRFESLWRLQLFVEKEARQSLVDNGSWDILIDAVGAALLPEGTPRARNQRMRGIALRLVEVSGLPYHGSTVLKQPRPDIETYPSGVATIRSFF